jgi:transposase
LLPALAGLHLEAWSLEPWPSSITLTLRSQQHAPCCPLCGLAARRAHSRYRRTLADLPWAEHRVTLRLEVRRLFCDNTRCERRIFSERLPDMAVPWARKTLRLTGRLTRVGLALGGAAGARLSRMLGLAASRNTLLRLIRRASLLPAVTPRVLGVDDWALRKRHRYGTVLVDLERRRPMALLPDREAETLARWLRDHPGAEIIARDRSGAYADGARRGAPEAVQVADRFHLLQNLAEALETVFTTHAADLRAVEPAACGTGSSAQEQHVRPARPRQGATALAKASERRERRLAKHRQVWGLRREGWSGEAIARQLGIGRSTVFRYLKSELFPERKGRSDVGRSRLDPWKPFLLARWNGGHRDSRQLFRALQQRGYRGSYPTLARYTQRLRQAQDGAADRAPSDMPAPRPVIDTPRRPFTPRTAAMLVLRRPEHRCAADTERLARLRARQGGLAEAIDLGQEFAALIRARQPDRLDPWLVRAKGGLSKTFRGFAKRLASEGDAIQAAVGLPWSTGQVEGQINRLKMLKRQMYGRANLDLLAQRFLLAA